MFVDIARIAGFKRYNHYQKKQRLSEIKSSTEDKNEQDAQLHWDISIKTVQEKNDRTK